MAPSPPSADFDPLDVRGILLHIGLNFLYIVQKKGGAFRFQPAELPEQDLDGLFRQYLRRNRTRIGFSACTGVE